MNLTRLFGFITGYMVTSLYFHSIKAYAMGVELETALERIGAVGTGLVILGVLMVLFKKNILSVIFSRLSSGYGIIFKLRYCCVSLVFPATPHN